MSLRSDIAELQEAELRARSRAEAAKEAVKARQAELTELTSQLKEFGVSDWGEAAVEHDRLVKQAQELTEQAREALKAEGLIE